MSFVLIAGAIASFCIFFATNPGLAIRSVAVFVGFILAAFGGIAMLTFAGSTPQALQPETAHLIALSGVGLLFWVAATSSK